MVQWPDVLSPTRRLPPWNVEYVRTALRVPGGCVRTLLMTARPWRFWAQLKMAHAVRARRLVAYVVFLVALVYGTFAFSHSLAILFGNGPSVQTFFSAGYAMALPWSGDPPDYYYVTQKMPVPGRPWTVSSPPSPYDLTRRFTRNSLDAVDVRSMLFGFRPTHVWTGGFLDALALIVFSLLPVLTAPLGMIALPQSRRQAKVLPRHIVRITVYSLPIVAITLAYALLRFTFADSWIRLYHEWRLVGWWVPAALLVLWWAIAIRRYLRMPHATGVAAACVVIGVLVGPVLLLVLWSAGAMLDLWR
jgi:hypothetical protein